MKGLAEIKRDNAPRKPAARTRKPIGELLSEVDASQAIAVATAVYKIRRVLDGMKLAQAERVRVLAVVLDSETARSVG
jgi:hypothetical protein